MMIEISTTDRRDGKALALFARCSEWQTGHTKDGRSFFAIPGSERGLYHMADGRECSCPDFRNRGVACKHVRAVRFWLAAFKTGAVAPKPRSAATADDDLIVLTPAGAGALIEQPEDGLASIGEIDAACMALAEDKRVRREWAAATYERLYGNE